MSSGGLQQHGPATNDTMGCCGDGRGDTRARPDTAPTTSDISGTEKEEESGAGQRISDQPVNVPEPAVTMDKGGSGEDIGPADDAPPDKIMEGDSETETELDPGVQLEADHGHALPSMPEPGTWDPIADPDTDVDHDTTMSGTSDIYEEDDLVEPDDQGQDDALSVYPPSIAFDAATYNSSTRSIYPGDLDYVVENERRYVGDCPMPNDDVEQDRMHIMHQVYLNLFDHQLTTVPLENPTLILDIGTGTGEWACAIAELYPDCEVVGTDISDIQPTSVPHNVEFRIDDCQVPWARPPTDLVHMRNMSGLIDSWPFVYSEAYKCLKPGGYIELLDFLSPRDGAVEWFSHFPADSQIHRLIAAIDEAGRRTGRHFGASHLRPELIAAAGFVDIEVQEESIRYDPDERVSRMWRIVCLLYMEAAYLRLLTRDLGWEFEEAIFVIESVNKDMKDVMMDPVAQQDFTVAYKRVKARKPLSAPWPAVHSAVASVMDEDVGSPEGAESA